MFDLLSGASDRWVRGPPRTLPLDGQPSPLGVNRGTVVFMEQDNIQTETIQADAMATSAATEAVVTEELLVEEISIDGMCGVY